MGKIVYPWSDSDTVHLMRIARDVADGYLGIDEVLAEFNNGAEAPRNNIRAIESKACSLAKKLSRVNSAKARTQVAYLKRLENLCRAERRRAKKMTAGNPFIGMKMTTRKITKAEKTKLLAVKKQLTSSKTKFSPTLEERVARLEAIVDDAVNTVNRTLEALKNIF